MTLFPMNVLFYLAGLPFQAGETGSIQLETNEFDSVIVLGSWFEKSARAKTKGGDPAEVKAGKYELADIRLFKNDENDNTWSTRCIHPETVVVHPGQTTTIKGIKGPGKAYVKTRQLGNQFFNFSFMMEDSNRNRYSYFKKNMESLPAPQFTVDDSDGNRIYTGQFYPG